MAEGFSAEESARYSRQLSLPKVGVEGQKRLRSASILIVGAGGLGSPSALYLAAAGVGRIGIVDSDRVDISNLHRQVLHLTSDVGRQKSESAAASMLAVNPEVRVDAIEAQLTSANALEILRPYDVVIDGSDNFPTRYLVNDACVLLGKPDIYGSVFRFEGQAAVFFPPGGPCYRCLYPEPPPPGLVPSCEEGGVLGVLPGIVGLIQATETLKLILGIGDSLSGRLLLFDALSMEFRELHLKKNPACAICGESPTIHSLVDYEAFCGVAAVPAEEENGSITPRRLAEKRARGEELLLIDVREPYEWEIGHLDGAQLIPMSRLASEVPRLDRNASIVVYCRTGSRSGRAAEFLRQSGFVRVLNLEGGINRWSQDVDPDIPAY
ncbi:MAG: molybdopterin-synthase adenylyltransferase MoeB [Acidobacteriota bacterium]